MESGVEIQRVGWVFVGGVYHYSNATKPQYKQQHQQIWGERLVYRMRSVNICQKAYAKRLRLFDCVCAFLLIHIKCSLGCRVQPEAEKASAGHDSKNSSQTKQQLVYVAMAAVHISEIITLEEQLAH